MTPSLYSIYGVRIASNPKARNWNKEPLLSARFGTRRQRRAWLSDLRRGITPSA